MAGLLKSCASIQIGYKFLFPSFEAIKIPLRGNKHLNSHPRKRIPSWLPKQTRVKYNQNVTAENAQFVKEVVHARYRASPLKIEPIEPKNEWTPNSRRTGVIAKKIGVYPMWLKDGTKVWSTLLQVLDNHVIRYTPPEEYRPTRLSRRLASRVNVPERFGCLVVGAEGCDPQKFTKEYCGLFNDSGVMPKRVLTRFKISPDAAIQPGTPIFAAHFKAGEIVDISGITIDRGFQGVCKRWGFKGGPASHGVTKTHRRPGNIGGGGEKGRVWPGTKMPGHMGNRRRIHRGVKILRINTKYNLLWVLGNAIPGDMNTSCLIYDTILPLRKHKTAPHFPTYLPSIAEEQLPEDMFSDDLHPFTEPTIQYAEES